MSEEKMSKETYREIVKPMADDLRKAESWCELDGVLNRSETMYNLYKMGYRKQSEGEWIFRNDGAYGRTRCYCSACGKHSGIGGIRENQLKPYCPNCGAKMKGGAE